MLVKFLIELFVKLLKAGIVFDSELYFFLLVNDAHSQALDTSNVDVVRRIQFSILESLSMQTLRGSIMIGDLFERIA
jgi:hypothetical protein